jgi:hypothetical protein
MSFETILMINAKCSATILTFAMHNARAALVISSVDMFEFCTRDDPCLLDYTCSDPKNVALFS